MEEENPLIHTLLNVTFDEGSNIYHVELCKGSNVAETAFAMSVVIKCLIRDGIVEKVSDVTDLITKYLNDPQYEEVKEDESGNDGTSERKE